MWHGIVWTPASLHAEYLCHPSTISCLPSCGRTKIGCNTPSWAIDSTNSAYSGLFRRTGRRLMRGSRMSSICRWCSSLIALHLLYPFSLGFHAGSWDFSAFPIIPGATRPPGGKAKSLTRGGSFASNWPLSWGVLPSPPSGGLRPPDPLIVGCGVCKPPVGGEAKPSLSWGVLPPLPPVLPPKLTCDVAKSYVEFRALEAKEAKIKSLPNNLVESANFC